MGTACSPQSLVFSSLLESLAYLQAIGINTPTECINGVQIQSECYKLCNDLPPSSSFISPIIFLFLPMGRRQSGL